MVEPLLPVWIKLVAAVICLFLSMCATLITRLQFFQNHPNALSYANSAGGGVILAVACSHLIPEVIIGFEDMDIDYPLGLTLILIGYVLILLLEKVIFQHEHNQERIINRKSAREHQHLTEEEDTEPDLHKKYRIVTPIILVIAVGLHSIFEGIVLGVQDDQTGTISLMIALVCHKPITTLFVGIVMVKEKVPLKWFVFLATVTCVAAPIGIGIGLLIMESEAPEILFATLTALAAGSFIYIGTTEIIAEEFQSSPSASVRWKKFFFLIVGAAIMLVLKIWLQDYHTEDDHHPNDNHTLIY